MTDDRDRFWDLSDLIPKKKNPPLAPFSHAVTFSDVRSQSAETGDRVEPIDGGTLTFPSLPELTRESVSYVPERNRLLTRVTVTHFSGGYRFYEEFRRDALALADIPGAPADYVPFYSSMPQYAHLDRAQKQYYLWFRETAKRGEAVRCDESYLRLYIYEIINLPDVIPPAEGVLRLITLWRLYRERFPGLNMQFAGWIADYCLVHRLSCPIKELRPIMDVVMASTDFREFYLGEAAEEDDGGLSALLSALSDYPYASGKFASGENAATFARHVPAALLPTVKRLLAEEKTERDGTIKRTRKAFIGALCSYAVKYEITVEYRSFSGSLSLRRKITAAVKYAENRLRALLSIRSRLAVSGLDEQTKSAIDLYFDRLALSMKKEREFRERPEYEARYDAADRTISFSGADEIERESWENAERLAPEEDASEFAPPPIPQTEPIETTDGGEGVSLLPAQIAFLAGLLEHNANACADAVRSAGVSVDGMVESVNELAAEEFGDIVIESTEDGYAVIEDYIEEVSKWTERR